MLHRIRNTTHRLYGLAENVPIRKLRTLIVAVVVISKAFIAWYTINQSYLSEVPGTFALCSGDCSSYLDPIEHLVDRGSYSPDYRMPGYGAIYLPLYLAFPKAMALNVLVLFQLLIDVVASILLIEAVRILTNSNTGALLALLFYGIACTVSVYGKFVLTETIAASFMAIAIHATARYAATGRPVHLFVASLFLTWAYFCRPVLFPLFMLLACYALWSVFRGRKLAGLIMLLLPFAVVQSAWTLRNYLMYDQVVLLTRTLYYPTYTDSQVASFAFHGTFADFKDSYIFPDRDWMNRSTKLRNVDEVPFPERAYTPYFTEDSVLELRRLARALVQDTLPAQEHAVLDGLVAAKLDRYSASIRKEHWFLVHVRVPVERSLQELLGSSGVQALNMKVFGELTSPEKALKLIYVLIYQLALYGSIGYVVLTIVRRATAVRWFLAASCLYGMLVHPILLHTSDPRYFYGFYPLVAVSGSLFWAGVVKRLAGGGPGHGDPAAGQALPGQGDPRSV